MQQENFHRYFKLVEFARNLLNPYIKNENLSKNSYFQVNLLKYWDNLNNFQFF